MTGIHEPIGELKSMVFSALFAALIAAGAFIAVPVGPVPIVLQNMMVLLSGLLLSPGWAVASVAIYLLAGALGLPVFAGGTSGIARIAGPTGGYLLSYIPAALVVAWFSSRGKRRLRAEIPGLILGSAIVYGIGVPWLKMVTGMTWQKAVAVGMVPFVAGDGIKIAAALAIARALRKMPSGRFVGATHGEYHRG